MFTFNENTPEVVKNILTSYYNSQERIRLVYGNVETGTDWLEEYDVIGTIGRSNGTIKIPLLIHNSRSLGGGHILDHSIVKMVDVKTKRVLYQHENYQTPDFNIEVSDHDTMSRYRVVYNNHLQATFSDHNKALNYIDFMLCKRMRK